MDLDMAHTLNDMNSAFYARYAASFSQTHTSAWKGWSKLAPSIAGAESILDVACGNMRFCDFAEEVKGGVPFAYYGVDSSRALAIDEGLLAKEGIDLTHSEPEEGSVEDTSLSGQLKGSASHGIRSYQQLDIVRTYLEGRDIASAIAAPCCELVVSFGFFHHVPGDDARRKLLRALVSKAVPGGKIAISFWHFMDDERLTRNATRITSRASRERSLRLEQGDYLLGWHGDETTLRYCHHFTQDEIALLAKGIAAEASVEALFEADGKAAPLNSYVVLKRLG